MRKIIAIDWTSVDGYFAAANGSFDWVKMDPAVEAARHEMGRSLDTLLFGGTTYRLFAGIWPQKLEDPKADDREKYLAALLTDVDKIVVSRNIRPTDLTWKNSRLLDAELAAGVRALKNSKGGDVGIFGSGQIIQQLARCGLMDEFILCVTPVALGDGKSLFSGVSRLEMVAVETRTFDSGNVIIRYRTANAPTTMTG